MKTKKGLLLCVFISSFISSKVTIVKNGLSYDDVLLVPQRSTVQSRHDVSTSTRLTKNITLNIPIVSSNMDTVTEADMAIAMARLGGIGIIHRFNSIEQQVHEVKKVKRYCNARIEKPLTISPESTLGEARALMKLHNVKGLLVADENNLLVGILTSRDIRFAPPLTTPVKELMTPQEKLIVGDPNTTVHEAKELLIKHRIEKIPLVNKDGTITGLITGKDIYNKAEHPYAVTDKKGRLLVGAAIGVREGALERAKALVAAGVDVLVIDIAHGHSDLEIETLKKIKKRFSVDVIAGNVATQEGTLDLIEAGADAIKVGVGPGSICTTRITTGSGYPQFSAIIHCAEVAEKYGIPIIADGGIKHTGDITKAIAAGASTVMLGNLLAGTDESPGIPFIKNGKKYKVVRGMASFGANLGRIEKTGEEKDPNDFTPEGVEALKPYKGSVAETISQLIGGFRSGMSYCGATTIEELCGNGTFIRITTSGMQESLPHDVQQLAI